MSGSLRYATSLDDVIQAHIDHNCDTYRFALNSSFQGGTRPWNSETQQIITDWLDTTSYNAIIDCNHTYGAGASGRITVNQLIRDNIASVISRCRTAVDLWASYGDRVIIEPVNEFTGTDIYTAILTPVVSDLRSYGYTGKICYHFLTGEGLQYPDTSWHSSNADVEGGWHHYFNSGTGVSSFITRCQRFTDEGIQSINTEIGASYNEHSDFDTANVAAVVDAMQQSYDEGTFGSGLRKIVSFLWMNYEIQNLKD